MQNTLISKRNNTAYIFHFQIWFFAMLSNVSLIACSPVWNITQYRTIEQYSTVHYLIVQYSIVHFHTVVCNTISWPPVSPCIPGHTGSLTSAFGVWGPWGSWGPGVCTSLSFRGHETEWVTEYSEPGSTLGSFPKEFVS